MIEGLLLGAGRRSRLCRSLLAAAALCGLPVAAHAKPARCFTTDEGSFSCSFKRTSRDGSFEIAARGKPTYVLSVEAPGIGYGFVRLGGRAVALPGRYRRDAAEPGCWVNDETSAKICAR